MAYGEDWSGVGPNWKPPASSASQRPRQNPNDPNDVLLQRLFPGVGDFWRNTNQDVGLQSFLNQQYVPPLIKRLLQQMLGNFQTQYDVFQASSADRASRGGYKDALFPSWMDWLNSMGVEGLSSQIPSLGSLLGGKGKIGPRERIF